MKKKQTRIFELAKSAITSQTIENGKFNLQDTCICYFEDSIETFVLKNEN